MIARLRDLDCILHDSVNKTVFLINATRPESRERVFQRFRFSDSAEVVALDILDECVHLTQHAFIISLPIKVILPGPI